MKRVILLIIGLVGISYAQPYVQAGLGFGSGETKRGGDGSLSSDKLKDRSGSSIELDLRFGILTNSKNKHEFFYISRSLDKKLSPTADTEYRAKNMTVLGYDFRPTWKIMSGKYSVFASIGYGIGSATVPTEERKDNRLSSTEWALRELRIGAGGIIPLSKQLDIVGEYTRSSIAWQDLLPYNRDDQAITHTTTINTLKANISYKF